MRCLVLLLSVVVCVRSAAAAAVSCALAEEFFARHNVSADDGDVPGPICGGHCCGRGRELQVKSSLRRAAETIAVISTKQTAELLLTTRRSLQDHLTGLSRQSQNKTTKLFTQVYQAHAARTVQPLASLYDDIRIVLRADPEFDSSENLNVGPPKDLAQSAKKLFSNIFPTAYHNVLKLELKQFTPEYEVCLKDAYDTVKPFGDIPQQLGSTLSRSLEAARALLQMLAVGADVLSTAQHVLSTASDSCADRLLRAAGCAHCSGHDARPCRNYCLNVARGCIGSLLVELDGPWAGYVEGVERLTKADADAALRELEAKVSNAIMYALENKAVLENKVRKECGPPSTVDSHSLTVRPTPSTSRRDNLRAPPPDTELLQFAANLASTKKMFSSIADGLCDQLDFAVEENEDCWNGNAVADYTKPLVPSASLSDQKYNPEISGTLPQDHRVAGLADRLQQARQLLISYSRNNEVSAEAIMQGDEAGEEGSGSGRSYPDDYDTEGSGDVGSGDSDDESRTIIEKSRGGDTAPPVILSSSSPVARSVSLFLLVAATVACL